MLTIQWNLSTGSDGNQSITAVIDGEMFVAEKDHPNFDEIKNTLGQRLLPDYDEELSDEEIRDLFDVSFKIGQKFEALSERVKVSGGRVFFDGSPIASPLTRQILRFHEQRLDDWKPLVRFFDKVMQNPNEHSREHLYAWLERGNFTIADDGDIIAYKSVQADYGSVTQGPAIVNGEYMNGHVPNKPGNVIEIAREDVVFDPMNACSFGLHAATFTFAQGFYNGPVMKLKINPRDVVSVPTHDSEKMRVCRYVVVEEVERPVEAPVENYTSYSDAFDEDDDDWGANPIDWEDEESDWDNEESTDWEENPTVQGRTRRVRLGPPRLRRSSGSAQESTDWEETEAILADQDTLDAIAEGEADLNAKTTVFDRIRQRFQK